MIRLHQIRFAIMMLTRLPMGRLPDPVPTLAASAWAFPLVGIVTGATGWAVMQGCLALGLAATLAAFLALAAMTWVSGALHEDGFADFADGMGGGRDRDHCLEIMRDSRIGSYGVVALVLMIGMKAAALSQLGPQASLATFVFAGLASRLLMLAALIWMPPARADGLGRTATGVSPKATVIGVLATALLALTLGASFFPALSAMALSAALVALLAHRRIGGQTGDVLGAVQSVSETVGWVALSALVVV
ncbi:MAG: adenosylcobinamide-GDP ribazoletransferase [Jhaorihella sp.]